MKTVYVPLIGRLGNCLFQYAYARKWAEQNGYELCLHPWVGEDVFNLPKAKRPSDRAPDLVLPEHYRQDQASLIYTRSEVRSWFQFKPSVLRRLTVLDDRRPDVLFNIRDGDDYKNAGLVMLSWKSYVFGAVKFGYDPCDHTKSFQIERYTDPTKLNGFSTNFSASGFGTTDAGIPSFYRLMTAPVLFRANSTFSWWAATLGTGKVYSPVIRGMRGGTPDQHCDNWVEGNWPVMADDGHNTDLHLEE